MNPPCWLERRLRVILLVVAALLLASPYRTHAQPPGGTFKSLPNDPGLAIRAEQCILQDSQGFLWFGTTAGLIRYDGNEFRQFRPGEGFRLFGWADETEHLCEDRAGNIWFSTVQGLNRFNRQTGLSTLYSHNPSDSTSLCSNYVNRILESTDGSLWVATQHGLDLFDRETGVFEHFRHDPANLNSLAGDVASTILEDRSGTLWVGHWGQGLDSYDPRTGLVRHYRHNPADSASLCGDMVHSLCQTSDSILWVGTWGGGLDRLNLSTGRFTHFRHEPGSRDGLSDNSITSLLQSSDGTLWVGTWHGGLNWAHQADGVFHSSTTSDDPYRNVGFTSADITSLYEDRNGILWIGSWRGVRYLDTRSTQIFYVTPPAEVSERRSAGLVTSLLQDGKGRIWVGTLGGLGVFDRSNGSYRHFRHLPGDLSNPADSWIVMLCADSSGSLWIGTWGGGLYSLDPNTNRFTHYADTAEDSATLDQNHPLALHVDRTALHVDRTGTLWVGWGSGVLDEFDRRSGRFRHHLRGRAVSGLPSGSPITAICEDSSGTLWIGTSWDGLDAFDRASGTFRHHIHDPANPSSPSGNEIGALLLDREGRIWIRTLGGEVDRLDPKTGAFEHFSHDAGKRNEVCPGFQQDADGNLWLAGETGIISLSPATRRKKVFSYPADDRLISLDSALSTTAPGIRPLIFVTPRGLAAVYPETDKRESHVPPVKITGLRVSNTLVNLDSARAADAQKISLSYGENSLAFDFAVLDYSDPTRNEYAYILEGVDRDWVYSGTRHYTSYSHLNPGKYRFRVRGSNNKGVWNEAGDSVTILIAPPWWRTTLASVVAGLLVLCALFGAWRLQVSRMKTRHALEMATFEAAKLHEVDELKSRFFANISHEFRTPLTLILGPVRQIMEGSREARIREELGLVLRNASRLLELINQLLDLSRLESGSMTLQAARQDVIPFLKGLMQSFCPYAERRDITLALAGTPDELLVYFDRDKLHKIVSNILTNAFKFTPAGGRVEVAVARENGQMAIRISDTGIGIPAGKLARIFDRFYQVDSAISRAQEGTGIGLSLCRELIELHKGTIDVESEEGKGSTFIIRLPLGSAHLMSDEILEPEEKTNESGKEKAAIGETGGATLAPGETEADPPPPEVRGKWLGMTELPLLLLVEDNADVRAYIRSDVEAVYRIAEAVDGQDGWDKAIEQIPDIIVSDIMMPRLDGLELCRMLKTDERTSHIPVILLTARAESQDKIAGFETGADDYIMKPFEPPELKARVANLLAQRKRLHEHFRKHGLLEIDAGRITSVDQTFLERLLGVIAGHISDPSFGVEDLAHEMALSKSLLLRKVEALVGEPPVAVIKRARLEKAAKLLEAGFGNISQVALEVGFNNPSYFAECFRKQFGVNPSEYHSGTIHSS